MFQEEIARLTGTLKFNVEARPLVAFEKRLNGVMSLLREFSTIANKKFTVKVALDSRSLRAQIDRATKAKISLTNIDVSNEALAAQSKRIQQYLDKTPIRMSNVKVDISKLVDQKKFVKTLMGQMHIDLPIKLGLVAMETELRREVKAIGARNPIRVAVEINQNQLVMKLRRAMVQAQKNIGALKIRVADPQVRLKVDKQHLIEEIKAAIAGHEFKIRVGATGRGGGAVGSAAAGALGGMAAGRGISAAAGFARGALPGLGAAYAFSQMNQINQQMQAQGNAMTAVMGSESAGKEQSAWVKNLSNTIGLDYRQVAPSYNKMLASGQTSGMSTDSVQNIFQGVSEYGRVMGLDSEAMKGSMRAIEQMMNKGQVMSEELKGQLAERMPGAMSAMAEAAGFKGEDGVAKLMEAMKKGDVKSGAVLEKFAAILAERARAGGALEKAMKSTAAEQARMNNAFTDAVIAFSEGGFDSGMAGFFRTMADGMQRAQPLIRALGGAFEILIKPLNAMIVLIGDLGQAWPDIAKGLGVSEKALAAFAVAVGVFMLPFGGFIAAIGIAALVLEDLVSYFKGGESIFGNMVDDIPGAQDQIDNLSQAFDHLVNSISEIGISFDGLKTKYQEVFGNVEMENPFVMMLRKMSELVENIASGLDRIAAVLRGDFQAGFSGLGRAYKEHVIDKVPGVKLAKYVYGEGLDKAGQFLNSYRTHETMPTPSPLVQPGMASAGQAPAPNITIPTITLTVQAPQGVTDPKQFAEGIQPHIQEMTNKAIRDAFGAARAQQAERQ